MDVIVKGQPSIEVRMEAKVLDSYKTVDAALSESSVNPVQNKAITEELNKKAEKSVVEEQGNKLTELSKKVNELDKGEAYIMGDTLTFRNYADASIEGETLKL